jgi:hypothetical protein
MFVFIRMWSLITKLVKCSCNVSLNWSVSLQTTWRAWRHVMKGGVQETCTNLQFPHHGDLFVLMTSCWFSQQSLNDSVIFSENGWFILRYYDRQWRQSYLYSIYTPYCQFYDTFVGRFLLFSRQIFYKHIYILHEIRKRKANWIGHILRRNCLLQRVTEGKIRGGGGRSDRKIRKKT